MPHWKPRVPVTSRDIAPGLHMFSTRDPASRRGKTYYCYLVETERGNVLVHAPDNTAFYRDHGADLDALGGVKLLFLTHSGDADPAWRVAAERWQAHVHGHALDLKSLGLPGGFDAEHALDGEHEIICLPGHTPGYVGLIRRQGKHRYLFGGHLLVQSLLGWRAPSGIRDMNAIRASLARIESLDLDILLPEYAWGDAGPSGESPVRFGPSVRKRAVAEALANLAAKAKRLTRGRDPLP